MVRDKSGDYRAESPDEKALIEGMAPYGCSLVERGSSNMRCVVAGKSEEYDILAVNEFNSDRKRMSVLVKVLPLIPSSKTCHPPASPL